MLEVDANRVCGRNISHNERDEDSICGDSSAFLANQQYHPIKCAQHALISNHQGTEMSTCAQAAST